MDMFVVMFKKMFIFICLLHGFLSVIYCEVCVDFYFGSSHYEATFVETDYNGLKTWNDLKEICEQSGYQLVSITSSDENDAILNFLQDNCTRGNYAIGLSRQIGIYPQNAWNWESGDTAMELLWGSNEPNVPVNDSAVVYMTTLEEFGPGKWYDIESIALIGSQTANTEYGYICEKSITTTQLSTTTDGTSMQSFSSSIIPLSSTYRMHTSVVATVNGEPKDRTGISDEPITKTNTENHKDLMMIVLVSASSVAAILVLILVWFRKRLCCKSKTKMNPELLMDDIAEDKPCDVLRGSTKNGCRDVDNEKMLMCNTLYNVPTKRPGPNVPYTIHISNSSFDNALEAEKYPVNQSSSAHDRKNPYGYESEENPTYEGYHDENSYRIDDGIKCDSEGEEDNPAYDALPFEASCLYSSPHEMGDVASSGDLSQKKTVVRAKHVGNLDNVADSNIDALYAKPDMSM
ncbi:uncharacterized protein LOC117102043 [Anneissia japonica]|uniref:uncharacterized protein LOC117102043 n=1 Tax=Anneissia japonica TaxID=1529436 RepID=UPI00142584E3|nr:uncharacterized protein LOC117102043 [Anneissia japonica]